MINILCYSANKYSELVKNNVIYTFTIGRKGKSKRIIIDFTNNEFYHLAGLHYIKDVEFPSPKAEEIFLLIRDNNEFQEKILASSKLPKIIERLTHIEHLDAVLNHPDDVVVWEQKRANFSTNLKADYLVSRMHDSVYDIFGIKKVQMNTTREIRLLSRRIINIPMAKQNGRF
ncbi:hypothetical protein R55210_AODCCCNP_00545 [Fructobacillus fructosus]|uniref:PBECR4 domain-containing protein n=1 Tax=Fructobacillus fructosus TaxID=1631 RepID=UPI002D91522C|nr:hypothetical protein R55210_AODCCCNP_00545 [Fructobacillus fructosus]